MITVNTIVKIYMGSDYSFAWLMTVAGCVSALSLRVAGAQMALVDDQFLQETQLVCKVSTFFRKSQI